MSNQSALTRPFDKGRDRIARDPVFAQAVIDEQDKEIKRLLIALLTIRDMPTESQDNLISANMRKVAREALDD